MATEHIRYCEAGIIDKYLEYNDSFYRENGISQLCLTTPTDIDDNEIAELCVKIVKQWLIAFSYTNTGDDLYNYGGLEASGIDKKYIETSYWLELLQRNNPPHKVKEFKNLFNENNGYRDADIASCIPDDPVERFVFHFIYDWGSKLKIVFQDEEVCEKKKLAVLNKQLENLVYYGQRRLEGSKWRMDSSPDELLKLTLTGQDIQTIQGRHITVSADPNIFTDMYKGPVPDRVDQRLYNNVLEYGKSKNIRNVNKWTMVSASFNYKDDDGEVISVRCCAFSGDNPEKTALPWKWWKSNPYERFSDFYFKENREILLAKGSDKGLGQNMVMSIFNALHTFYEEDLKKLTEFIAFEDCISSEDMIMHSRNDLDTLDYGEYYDKVIEIVNRCNRSIIETIIEDALPDQNTPVNSYMPLVTCGFHNKQYQPDSDGLNEIFTDPNLFQRVNNISTRKLSKLKRDLERLPSQHLLQIRTVLGRRHCGEDNVLPLLLSEMLKRVKVFLATRVTFIALDAEHFDGKLFCSTCNKKVRFFSILPSALRFLGNSGEDKVLENFSHILHINYKKVI